MRKSIASLAEIRSGYQFREKVEHDPNGQLAVIQIKDLTADFQLDDSNLVRVSPPKSAPYRVNKGDVLFLARGLRLGAVAITEPIPETIATAYFLILRPNDEIRPGYLAWALNQPAFQGSYQSSIRGSHIPLITKADFGRLELDVPPLDTQMLIESIDALHRREMLLSRLIEEKRKQLIQTICQKAATRP